MKRILAIFLVMLATFMLVACQEEATALSITVTAPTKVEYQVNEEFDGAGMVVKVLFSDGSEATLTSDDYTVTGFSSSEAGLVTLTVTYLTKTATFGIAIYNPDAPEVALSIKVLTTPTQQFYLKTETFSPAGLTVEATYSTGRKAVLTSADYELSGFLNGIVGNYDVLVTYRNLTTTFPAAVRNVNVQGVSDTEILVGNTATTEFIYTSFIGLPFNAGINAALEVYNEAGGFQGKTVRLINYDDSFNGTNGLQFTRKLVEEDKIFALVGHFGTPTIGSTMSYIRETGVPMVYAATGAMGLYKENSPLDPVMPVQPLFLTDGRLMAARAFNESVYGANDNLPLPTNSKIGVLYTNADDGIGMKTGIEIEAKAANMTSRMIYKSFVATDVTALTAAVEDLRAQGVAAIIIAANQTPMKTALGVLNTQAMTVPVFSSYVNADPTAVDTETTYGFDIYTNAWLDVTSPTSATELAAFESAIDGASFLTTAEKDAYKINAFAIAGYVAGSLFVDGLKRVGTGTLTWESYIKAIESAPWDIPMGGTINFANGQRIGITDMSLLKYELIQGDNPLTTAVETKYAAFVLSRPIENLDDIRG